MLQRKRVENELNKIWIRIEKFVERSPTGRNEKRGRVDHLPGQVRTQWPEVKVSKSSQTYGNFPETYGDRGGETFTRKKMAVMNECERHAERTDKVALPPIRHSRNNFRFFFSRRIKLSKSICAGPRACQEQGISHSFGRQRGHRGGGLLWSDSNRVGSGCSLNYLWKMLILPWLFVRWNGSFCDLQNHIRTGEFTGNLNIFVIF